MIGVDWTTMTFAEWAATITAWNRLNSGKANIDPPTEAEFKAAVAEGF